MLLRAGRYKRDKLLRATGLGGRSNTDLDLLGYALI